MDQVVDVVPTEDDVDVPMMPDQAAEPGNPTRAVPEDWCGVPTQEDESAEPGQTRNYVEQFKCVNSV